MGYTRADSVVLVNNRLSEPIVIRIRESRRSINLQPLQSAQTPLPSPRCHEENPVVVSSDGLTVAQRDRKDVSHQLHRYSKIYSKLHTTASP